MDHLLDCPAVALADAIRARDVSSVEVVSAFLERIEERNPRVNALVQVPAEAALALARRADAALADGEADGPLHGVPFTAKDILDTAGVVRAAGLPERASHLPTSDAVVVARLQAAGAILLGKTNCPPWGGGGATDNPVYGRTSNPYDISRSAGGSSGGEAAAQAAGMSPLGLGSDSGGSIRLPAHYCGVAGLKPTSGRVPSTGALELPGGLSDPRSQIGPMSRFVADLWPAFAAIAGPDGHDSGVVPLPLGDPAAASISGLRLAWFDDDGVATPTPSTRETVRRVAVALASSGIEVSHAVPPALEEAGPITRGYWHTRELTGAEVEDNLLRWDRFRTVMLGFMADVDAILCPVDHQPAIPHGTDDPHQFSYTLPWSLTGYPCVVVRAGTSPEGLPIGVQVVAGPWREDVAIAVALEVERRCGGWQPVSW
jgi:amidase